MVCRARVTVNESGKYSDELNFSWWYKTNSEDIGFAIYYVGNGDKLETVFPNICLECALVPESGQMECKKVGKCTLNFRFLFI